MADGRFEQFHVPQQSRRDKLRVNQLPLHGILDPADFIACAGSGPRHIRSSGDSKEEVSEFMGYVHGGGMYVDPPLNPTQLQDITPFLYNPFHSGGEMMAYRPSPEQVCSHIDHAPNSYSNSGQGLSLSLNLQRYDSSMCVFPAPGPAPGGGGSTSGQMVSRSSVPLGPFTGYPSILKGSRFLVPAQLLLAELCDVGRDFYGEKINVGCDSILPDPVPTLEGFSGADEVPRSCRNGGEEDNSKKKSRLISMLHEVHWQYKQYYQQMQLVITSFESVAGVRNAAPFACLALKSMFKHFSCLKSPITEQLQMVIESRGHTATNDNDLASGSDTPGSGMHYPGGPQVTGYIDQPVWRPQRGLPERAVTVLRSWLFDHFLHPYPTDTDKLMLAKQTGLSRNQVSNWFINARVRLWKPMVEEIHMLETRQGDKEKDDPIAGNNNSQNRHFPTPPDVVTAPENDATAPSGRRCREIRQKRARGESNMIPFGNDQTTMNNVSYENSIHPGGGFGGVSLTLGLYQNNNLGLGLPDPCPMNAARRFGLDGSSGGLNSGGYPSSVINQNRHAFGREMVRGQLLHDFVG